MVIISVVDTLGGSPRSIANSSSVNVCLPPSKSVSPHAKMQTEVLSCVSTLNGKSVEHSVSVSKDVNESMPAGPESSSLPLIQPTRPSVLTFSTKLNLNGGNSSGVCSLMSLKVRKTFSHVVVLSEGHVVEAVDPTLTAHTTNAYSLGSVSKSTLAASTTIISVFMTLNGVRSSSLLINSSILF